MCVCSRTCPCLPLLRRKCMPVCVLRTDTHTCTVHEDGVSKRPRERERGTGTERVPRGGGRRKAVAHLGRSFLPARLHFPPEVRWHTRLRSRSVGQARPSESVGSAVSRSEAGRVALRKQRGKSLGMQPRQAGGRPPGTIRSARGPRAGRSCTAANLHTKILDFRGFDSSRILILI